MYEYEAKVLKVIDGDTADVDIDLGFNVILRNQRVRFVGIDAPESRTSDSEEKIYGNMAKEFVESYLVVGQNVILKTFADDRGKFGRILGDFTVYDSLTESWTSLCNLMLNNHHAVVYNNDSKEDMKENHLKNRVLLQEKM